jgi:hypothetical protein
MTKTTIFGLAAAGLAIAGFSIPQQASAAALSRPAQIRPYVVIGTGPHPGWWYHRRHYEPVYEPAPAYVYPYRPYNHHWYPHHRGYWYHGHWVVVYHPDWH